MLIRIRAISSIVILSAVLLASIPSVSPAATLLDLSGDWSLAVKTTFSASGLGKVVKQQSGVLVLTPDAQATLEVGSQTITAGTFTLLSKGTKVAFVMNEAGGFASTVQGLVAEASVKKGVAVNVRQVTVDSIKVSPFKISKQTNFPGKWSIKLKGVVDADVDGEPRLLRYSYTGAVTFTGKMNRIVRDGFVALTETISGLCGTTLTREQCDSLNQKLASASDAYEGGQSCAAADFLGTYLSETQGLRQGSLVPTAEDLHNRGWTLRYDLITGLLSGQVCPGYERFNMHPALQSSTSDNQRYAAQARFGEPRLMTVQAEGETFTQVHLPGVPKGMGVTAQGYPDVPIFRRLLAVPRGATASIQWTTGQARILPMNLFPLQAQPVDQVDPEFEDPPFVWNTEAYATDQLFPPTLCGITSLGYIRDVQIAELACATGQYNPVTDQMTLYDSIDFEVAYAGGQGAFITEGGLGPFESMLGTIQGMVINGLTIASYPEPDPGSFQLTGEELMILTHPDFRPAADRLAQWKNRKGIPTHVFEVNDGAGAGPDTADEIRGFIADRYQNSAVRPSYVLLFGDAEYVPTYQAPSHLNPAYTIGSDYYYSILGDPHNTLDYLSPDLGVGRIPSDTLAEANIIVDKIITYESSPPTLDSFYQNASLASQFQCCRADVSEPGTDQRTFIEVSEFARRVLLDQGYTAQRIYMETGTDTPWRYWDGSLLPPDLWTDNGFTWNGSQQDIIDAFNAGRFLVIHRDHGALDQWSHPRFDITDVANSLNNGDLLPVVFSVNCASGWFDDEESLVEALLRKQNGGAVGVLGDTRNSPSWPNTYLLKGMIDAIWPDALPGFGTATPKHRLGDILNHAKAYMLSQMGAYIGLLPELLMPWTDPFKTGIGETLNEYLLWHVFGDPTLELWTANPSALSDSFSYALGPDSMTISYSIDEAIITAYQEGDDGATPIGRGVVRKKRATLPYVIKPDPSKPILLSVSKPNAVSKLLTSLLSVEPVSLDFGTSATEASLTINNAGGGSLTWTVTNDLPAWLSLSAMKGTAKAGAPASVTVSVDRSGLGVGSHEHTITITSSAGNATIPVRVEIEGTLRWAKTYAGPGDGYEEPARIVATDDGGYAVAGFTSSFGNGREDVWVLKLDAEGNVQWENTYGGSSIDKALSILPTSDGGLLVAGYTYSYGVGGSKPDAWLLKLSSSGSVDWQKTYGGTGGEWAFNVTETFDGNTNPTGYLAACWTESFSAQGWDAWVLRLDTGGNVVWEKRFGRPRTDLMRSGRQTPDGGYILAGETDCDTADTACAGGRDIWVLRLDSAGGILWQKTYGGPGYEYVRSLLLTEDGGAVVAGRTGSVVSGQTHAWVLRLNSSGGIVWQKAYIGAEASELDAFIQTTDGGYMAVGTSDFADTASDDIWALKLDGSGGIVWQKKYHNEDDTAYAVTETPGGEYILAGTTNWSALTNGDLWVLKLGRDGSLGCGIESDITASASVTDTLVTPKDTAATEGLTTATVTVTTVTGSGSSAVIETQCEP